MARRMKKTATLFCSAFFAAAAFTLIMTLMLAAIAAGAAAIGVSTPYLEENTMLLPEGGSPVLFTVTLQNVDKEDVSVRVGYSSDGDIAKIIDYKETYVLKAGTLDNKLTFNITLPAGAKIGSFYQVRFSITPLSAQSGGIISVAAGLGRDFKVKVVRNPDKFYFGQYLKERGLMWLLIITILAGYVAYGIYKRKKGKSRKIF